MPYQTYQELLERIKILNDRYAQEFSEHSDSNDQQEEGLEPNCHSDSEEKGKPIPPHIYSSNAFSDEENWEEVNQNLSSDHEQESDSDSETASNDPFSHIYSRNSYSYEETPQQAQQNVSSVDEQKSYSYSETTSNDPSSQLYSRNSYSNEETWEQVNQNLSPFDEQESDSDLETASNDPFSHIYSRNSYSNEETPQQAKQNISYKWSLLILEEIKNFLAEEPLTPNQILEISSTLSKDIKVYIIEQCLLRADFEEEKEFKSFLMNKIELDSNPKMYKYLIYGWINIQPEDKRYNSIVNLVKSNVSLYEFVQQFLSFDENIWLCKDLYPDSEQQQVELLIQFIKMREYFIFKDEILKYLCCLQSDNLALECLDTVNSYLCDDKDKLLVNNKFKLGRRIHLNPHETPYSNFIKFIQEDMPDSMDNFKNIVDFITSPVYPTLPPAQNVLLCFCLYPDDDQKQVDLFKQLINRQHQRVSDELISSLCCLQSDVLAFECMQAVTSRGCSDTEKLLFTNKLELGRRIHKNPNENIYDHFIKFIQEDKLGSIYNVDNIADFIGTYIYPSLSEEEYISLCRDLYPDDEYYQCELFKELIYNDQINRQQISYVKSFIVGIHSDDLALELIEALPEEIASESDILDITSNRLQIHYISLRTILSHSLEESLTENGLALVKTIFGEDIPELTLASLFSYYAVRYGSLEAFKSLLKPEILQSMKEEFKPADAIAFIPSKEAGMLNKFIPQTANNIPKVTLITEYLANELEPVPSLDDNYLTNYRIHFTDAILAPSLEKQEELNRAFIVLLENKKPTTEAVFGWFNDLLQLDQQNITVSLDQQEILRKSFIGKKTEIAEIFKTPGGVSQFYANIHALGDGCVANFSTHVTNAALRARLIKDPRTSEPNLFSEVLLRFYDEHIATPLLNQGDDKLGGTVHSEYTSILSNPYITKHYLSPNGVITKLAGSLDYATSAKCIRSALGEEISEALIEILDRDHYKNKTNLLAAYLVVYNTIPMMLVSRYVSDISTECRSLVEQAEAHIKQKQELAAPFQNVSSAIMFAVKLSPNGLNLSLNFSAKSLGDALQEAFNGDIENLKREWKIPNPNDRPDGRPMRQNNAIQSIAKRLAEYKPNENELYMFIASACEKINTKHR